MTAAIPDTAERHDILTAIKRRIAPSQLCPGAEQVIPVFSCPGCDTEQPLPYSPTACPSCGLMLCVNAGALYVWKAQAA